MTELSGKVILRQIASARAGDKGDTSNVAVWAYDIRHYPTIRAQLTADRVKAALALLVTGNVRRYELDHLAGLNFVMTGALEGGVNASLNLDTHGKSFSFLLLDLEIDLGGATDDADQGRDCSSPSLPAEDPDVLYLEEKS